MQTKSLFAKVMKKMICSLLSILVALTTLVIYGGLLAPGVAQADMAVKQNPSNPRFKVTVADPGGRVAFKGMTDPSGAFATGNLAAGNYIVQFNSSGGATKGGQFTVVIAAGKKKVSAESVAGEKFNGGGVAMKIDVGDRLNIAGQVTSGLQTKVDSNGKKMVWIPKKMGSNLPGHWAAEDSAEAKEAMTSSSMSIKNMQDRQAQGITPFPPAQSGAQTMGPPHP
jgi:hypothetical protein